MKYTLRVLSALLSYPSEELQANVPAIRSALLEEGLLRGPALSGVTALLDGLETGDILELQGDYSGRFDSSRSLSLHLFEHVHGDSRDRGQAMIDLGEQYLKHGFMMQVEELPDFIPLFLEFLSCLPPAQARDWLREPGHVFVALAQRLEDRQSPHAAVFHAITSLTGRERPAAAVSDLVTLEDPQTHAELDKAWEDAPINFAAPPQDVGGPTGLITRLRAAQRQAATDGRKGARHA